MDDANRIKSFLEILEKTYPDAKIVLKYGNPWELLVAVILSAQCTDVTVNKVTEKLFKKYPSLVAYIKADTTEFENDIHATGFYHHKAKNILQAAKLIQNDYRGQIPTKMAEMLKIPGVARKTANVVLGNAYNFIEGIAVDTHVIRLSQRLRMVPLDKIGGKIIVTFQNSNKTVTDYKKDADPVKIEKELMQIIPKEKWFKLTYQLIDHGRAVCRAVSPKCNFCALASICPVRRR
jgi:endonuclease III